MDGLLHLEAIPLPDRRLATTHLQAHGKNPKATAQSSPVAQCHREHCGHIHSIYPLSSKNNPAVLCCVLSQSNWKTPATLCIISAQLNNNYHSPSLARPPPLLDHHLLPHFLISILPLYFTRREELSSYVIPTVLSGNMEHRVSNR